MLWRKKIKTKKNQTVLYDGPSQLTGEPILLVVTGTKTKSQNRKTGDMLQAWILPKNIKPVDAVVSGADEMVCGDCKHRPSKGGACYVNVGQAPSGIWKALKDYTVADPSVIQGAVIRFGAWGDPAAIPAHVWKPIVESASRWTAYTHQWKDLDVKDWGWCMASVDTWKEYHQAKKAGWRTFRAILEDETQFSDKEIECLADAKDLQCSKCLLCDGNGRSSKIKDIYIKVHGRSRSRAKAYMST